MVYEKHKKHEMGLERTVELFEQTQFNMQAQAGRSVNTALVVRNWLFGWYIVEYEKTGANRKDLYGRELMVKLSEKLSGLLGKGFSRRSLDQFRQFYETYEKIWQTLSAKYQLYLPSKDELRKQLEEAQREWEADNER